MGAGWAHLHLEIDWMADTMGYNRANSSKATGWLSERARSSAILMRAAVAAQFAGYDAVRARCNLQPRDSSGTYAGCELPSASRNTVIDTL